MTNGNEPVNPIVEDNNIEGQLVREMHYPGLTKREYFAAMAMQGLLANTSNMQAYKEDSELSVKMADALINALNEKL